VTPQTDLAMNTSSTNQILAAETKKVLEVSTSSPNRPRYSIEHVKEKKD